MNVTILIVNMVDMVMIVKLIRVNESNHKIDRQYGECGSDQANNEGYGVNRCIGINQRHHFYGDGSYIYSKYF